MTLDRDRPEILQPPANPPACCTRQTLTVPPAVTAKTAQKHDYPSRAHRRSYARRTGAERSFATAKDPATNHITRGWCRLMGLTPLMLFTTTLLIVRNQRILTAWDARQQDNARRAARGLPPKTRKRRRKTLTTLATATRPPWKAAPAHPNRSPPMRRHRPRYRTPRAPACPEPDQDAASQTPKRTPPRQHPQTRPLPRNVTAKRENRPHGNVKTSWSR